MFFDPFFAVLFYELPPTVAVVRSYVRFFALLISAPTATPAQTKAARAVRGVSAVVSLFSFLSLVYVFGILTTNKQKTL